MDFPQKHGGRGRGLGKRGVAMIELSLALPVLMLLILGAADAAFWIRAAFRLDELTAQLGQIITQCPQLNDPGDMTAFFADAQAIAGTVDISSQGGGAFIITAMGASNGAPTVLWQKRIGNPTFGSHFGAVGKAPVTGAFTIGGAEVLIGTEAFSTVQPWRLAPPLLVKNLPLAPQLYSQSMFLVRSSSPSQLATLGTGTTQACAP